MVTMGETQRKFVFFTKVSSPDGDVILKNYGVKTMKVANKNARQYVDGLKEFEGSNIFAEHTATLSPSKKNLYVVYSYGYHFPMYIYDIQAGMWIGNEDSYSMSTSRQQSQCRPSEGIECWLPTNEMKEYVRRGSLMNYMEVKAKQEVAFLID
jgi:hypothetical protein